MKTLKLPLKTLKLLPFLKRAKKAKRRIAAAACIILVVGIPLITYTLSHLKPAEAAWWNDNWAFRKEIPISAHTAAENNVYILPGQELTPTTFSGANNVFYTSAAMIDSDSVVIAYKDSTASLGKFAVYNTSTGAQELAPTTFSGAANVNYVGAEMMDADSVAIAYDDGGATRGKYTVYNTTSGSQELAPTTFSGAADAGNISVAKVDSNSLAIAYNDVSASRGKYTVYNTSTGTQELAPTIFSGTSSITFSSIKMADADSIVLTYTDGSSSIGKFSVYNTTTGAQELTQTAFSGTNLAVNISAAMVDSNSVVIAYDDASATAGKYTVYNTSGAQELAPTTFTSGNNPNSISTVMMDSDSMSISYNYTVVPQVGKYTVYNVSTGSQEYAETAFSGANSIGNSSIVKVDSDSAAIAYGDSASFTGKLTVVNTTGVAADTSNTSKFQSDCGDVRFTDASGNILPYYIVSGCGTSATSFHVFFENFPAGAQSIYMYYGNPSATNGFSNSDFATAATAVTLGTQGSEENAPLSAAYWKFDEGYGTAAFDSASATASATLVNMDSPASTRSGWMNENFCVSNKCIKFPGGASGSVTVSKPYTNIKSVAFWVKPASTSAAMITLDGGSKSITATSGTISANNFSSPTIYVNGVQASTLTANQWNYVVVTTATGITAPTIKIGNVLGNFLSGFMDEVKLFSDVRTAAQVKVDYNSIGGNGSGGSNVLGASDNNPALSNGLVGYWKMDESTWLQDCNQGVVADSSGNGNNGKSCPSATGPAGGAQGKFGNGGSFDGTNDYLDAGSNVAIANSSFTLSAWAKRSSSGTHDFIFGHGADEVNSQSLHFGFRSTDTFTCAFYGDDLSTAATYTDTNWHLWTCTYDTSSKKRVIYRDGVIVASDTAAANYQGSGPLYIGKLPWTNTGYWFAGTLDEARIYNRALSGNEVANLYNWAPGPIVYWNFEEGNGLTVNDRTGNGNSGTWIGTLNNQWKQGKYGKAGSYNNTDNCVDNTATTNFPTGDFTYTGWFYPNATSEGFDDYFNSTTSGNTDTFEVYSDAGNLLHVTLAAGGMTMDSGSGTTTPGKWNYVTITRLGSTVTVYINGVAANTGTYGTALSAQSKFYTGGYQCGTDWYNGKIDEVKVYNYAITSSQITSLMNAGHPPVGSPVSSPVGYWKFDNGYGNVASNSGSLAGAANANLYNMATGNGNTASGWTPDGKYNKALAFDGNNDYVGVSNAGLSTATYTLSFWANGKNASDTSSVQGVVAKATGTARQTNYGFSWSHVSASFQKACTHSTATDTFVASKLTSALNSNTWYYITCTYDGTNLRAYLNGRLENTAAVAAPQTGNGTLVIGASYYDTVGSNFPGRVDDVKVYTYPLTDAQVLVDFNRSKNLVLGALSDTSQLTGGSVASNSASAEFCVPGSSDACTAPIGRWDFEEGTAGIVNDISGNNNIGTWNGTLGNQWTTGKIGKAGNFNGTDNFVDAGSGSILDNLSALTFSAWIYPTGTGCKTIASKDADDGPTSGWQVGMHCGTDDLHFEQSFTGNILRTWASNGSIANNKWQHIEVTWDGTNLAANAHIYVNGKEVSYQDLTNGTNPRTTDAAQNMRIGNDTNSIADDFPGKIDHVRLYNYVRTPAQVAWDYNRGKPLAYWKMDECQGTTLHDSSGNNYSAAITIGVGTYTTAGTCTVSSASSMWYNGRNGKYNYSMAFDGNLATNDTFAAASGANLSISQDISQSAWFWTSTDGATRGYDGLIYNSSGATCTNTPGYYIVRKTGTNKMRVGFYDSGGTDHPLDSPNDISLSTWNHIAMTYKYSTGVMNMYINGKLVNTTTLTPSTAIRTNTQTCIGNNNTNFFSGQMDDTMIFNYPMTAAQIRNLYNQNAAVRFGPLTGAP